LARAIPAAGDAGGCREKLRFSQCQAGFSIAASGPLVYVRLMRSVCWLLTLSGLSTPASGQVLLDASFDHGSLKSYSVVSPTSTTPTINLVGRDNFYGGGQWRWLYFRADGLLNKRPTFSISDNFAGGASRLNTHPMVWSSDGANWNFFDNNGRSGGRFNFSNSTTFGANSIQVAYAVPYSYGKSVAHTQQVLATPWAEPTGSGDSNGVIGMSPGGVDDLGRTVTPRPIYAYRISDPQTDFPAFTKRKVVVATGMHAGETLGTHTYQGLVDFLVSDDPRAFALRNVVEVYAYPTMNPDGRFAGHSRSTIANPSVDPNGYWHPTRWTNHGDIRVNGEAMMADVLVTAPRVDAFVDFHSTIPSAPGDDFGFIEYEQGDNLAPWWVALKQLQPNILDTDSTGTSWTSANFAEALLGAEVDVTFETQFGFRRPVSYYHDMGRNFGLAFLDAWGPTPGDTNFNRSVNFEDLLRLAQNYGALSGANWRTGDFDYDADVDFSDLLALAQNYGSTSFMSDWVHAKSLVPEPGVVGLLAWSALLLRRQRVLGRGVID
jgi:hypothetical protein